MLRQVRIKSHKLLVLVAFLALTIPLSAAFAALAGAQEDSKTAAQPTITSDKEDYPPGGTVILTGSDWQPGESVNIVVDDDGVDERDWRRDVTVAADESGQIRDEFQLPDWFVANYSVKATGAQSGVATTTFTDAVAAQLQGQSNPACTSGGGCELPGGWQNGNLTGWQELDEIPFRLKFPASGTFTFDIPFDHFQTSSGAPGIQNLYNWNPSTGVTLQGQPTLTTGLSGGKWKYTLTVNVASNATNPRILFRGNLAAGAHNFTGSSLALGGPDVGGTVQIAKPAARPGNPDLAVDKTGPTTAGRDEVVTYTLNYQNKSAATSSATGVQLTDVLPSGVTYVANSCSGTCTVAGDEVVWNLGTLAPGASGSRTLQIRTAANANSGAQYTDIARIRSAENDPNPSDNDDSLTTTVQFNRAPDAVNDSLTTNEDTPNSVNVLSNDTDPDGNALSVTGNTQPTNGSVTRSGGTFTYTPNANYNGPDSFNYTISDGNGGTDTATVNVTVNPVNDAPVAVDNSYSVNEDGTLSIAAPGVLGNDTDVDGNSLTAVRVAGPSNGTLTLNANGSFTYTPNANFNGSDSFTYRANDGSLNSNVATVTITVNAVNDAPTFTGGGDQTVNEDSGAQTVAGWASSISAGPNETGQNVSFVATNNNNGLFSAQPAVSSSGQLTYTPAADKNGQATVTVRAKDDNGTPSNTGDDLLGDPQAFTITVNPVNDAPGFTKGANQTVDEDSGAQTVNPWATNISRGPSDEAGQTVDFVITNNSDTALFSSQPAVSDGGVLSYTPSANRSGTATLTLKIRDNGGIANGGVNESATQSFTITVNAVNDAPVANDDDGYTEQEGQTLTVQAPGLLGNDTDIESGALKVCEIRVQRNGSTATASGTNISVVNDEGTIVSDGTGAFTFDPSDPDYFGTFTFEYRACDPANAKSGYATVTITYNNVNDAPRIDLNGADNAGVADTATFTEDQGAVDVDTGRDLTVTDVDNANMQSGSVALLNRKPGDVLSINETLAANRGISVTNNGATTGVITLQNVQHKDDYRDLLRTVRFNNNSENPDTTNRNVEFEVVDNGGLSSNKPDSVITVIEVNDDPTLTASNDGPINEGGSVKITGTATDPDSPPSGWRYSFDCNNDGDYTDPGDVGPQTSNEARCTFPDNGNFTVNVKVTDGEGGSAEDSTTVTVNNLPPDVDPPQGGPNGEDQSSDEGQNKPFDLGSFTDPGADGPWAVIVDWGDSSPVETFNASAPGNLGQRSHAYDDNGSYTVTVTVREAGGPTAPSGTETFEIDVANVNPAALLVAPNTADEGDDIDFSLINPSDPSGADRQAGFTYAFKCGNGAYGPFGASNESTCPTTNEGTYTVSAKIRDKDGGENEYSQTVTVDNVLPEVTAPEDQSSDEGSANSFDLGSFVDPGIDGPWTIMVDWGDGSPAEDFTSLSPGNLARQHTYDDNGTYTVRLVVDEAGLGSQAGETSFEVAVANVNPAADLVNDGPIDENESATVSFTGQNDPSGADRNAGLRYAYNCDGAPFGTIPAYADLSTNDSTQCSFPDDGSYTVRGLVMDKDGGYSVDTTEVVVDNVGPEATDFTGEDDRLTTPEETPLNITLRADNPGGDALSFAVKNGPANGTLSGAGTDLTYTPNGNFNGLDSFTFEVCDDDTPKKCDTGTVEILVTPINDAPVIDLKPADNTTTDDEVRFTEGDPNGVFADENQNLTISDVDSSRLESATVRITNHKSGDSLMTSATDPNVQITSYDPTTGELKFEGAATLDAYRDLLRTVRFDNGSDNPNTDDRNVEFVVTDDEGNDSLVSNTAVSVVRVAAVNDPPVIESVVVTNANPVQEGSPATIEVTATDPDNDPADLRYSFDCDNDGAYEVGPQGSDSAQCTYFDNGTYPVNVRVADGEGQDAGSDTGSVNVPVVNVAPTASFDAAPNAINEGQNVQLSLTGVQDPGTADTHEYRFDCGGGNFGAWGSSSTASCPASDDGPLTLRGQVRDDDGGESPVYQETITVNNVAPSVMLKGPGRAEEGQTKNYTYTVNDPGNDTFTVEQGYPSCGANGALEGTPVKTGVGGSFSCRFPDGGATTNVQVSVRDDDGAVDADGQRVVIVEIANVAPVLTPPANQNATEGTSKNFDLGSFTDPGTDADWSVRVNWGDNSTDTTFKTGTPGNLGQKAHRYANNGVYTVTVTVAEAGESGPPVALQEGGPPSDTKTFRINVANVAPTVTLNGPTPVDEGSTRGYAFRITDPGGDTQSPQAFCGANGTRVDGTFQYDGGTKRGSFECEFPNVEPQGRNTRLTVTTNDGDDNGSASRNVAINNVAPAGNDDTMTTSELKQVKANLLDNDDDPGQNLDRSSMELVSVDTVGANGAERVKAAATSSGSLLTGGGKVDIDALLDDGTVTYMPNLGFADIDAFRYKVCDTDGDCTGARVDVEVGPVDCSARGGAILGTDRADVLRGTPGDDVICALGGNDRVYGGGGTDILVGAEGWDRMWSEDGTDLMRGGSGTDTMDAGLGDDLLFGDAGRDVFMGRGGDDLLEMKDGSAGDAGNGGAGTDTCSRDGGDKIVSCEVRE